MYYYIPGVSSLTSNIELVDTMTISGFAMQRYTLPSKNGQLTKRELAGHRKSFQRIVHYYMVRSSTTTLLVFLMKLHCIQFAKILKLKKSARVMIIANVDIKGIYIGLAQIIHPSPVAHET